MSVTEAAGRVATIRGVALRPGVSRNSRRYTVEAIRAAHSRLAKRLADPNGKPVVMRTHHPGSKSDLAVTNITGRLTRVECGDDGVLRFEADIPDTAAGRDVAALVTPDAPYLANVSIRGWWVGDTRTDPDGCETGDDLEIDGLDFTPSPGVDGARIESADLAETHAGRTPIYESVEDTTVTVADTTPNTEDATVTDSAPADGTVDEAAKEPYGDVAYADPGYQKDGKKRYPLDTKEHVRAAWAYINKQQDGDKYTAAQLRRVKARIKAAAPKFGVKISQEAAAATLAALTEAVDVLDRLPADVAEAIASVSVSNGPADISVSAYGNDPADLQAVVGRLAAAVLAALDTVDPDQDGDIDLKPGDHAESHDPASSATTAAGTTTVKEGDAVSDTTTSETAPEAASQEENTTSAETTETAGQPASESTPATSGISEDDRAAIVTQVVEALKNSQTEAPAEATLAETFRLGVVEGVKAAKAEFEGKVTEAIDQVVALYKTGGRRGLIKTDESGAPAKPLHEMSSDELAAYANDVWSGVLPGRR